MLLTIPNGAAPFCDCTKKNPGPLSGTGAFEFFLVQLLRREVLVIAQVHDVLEHGRAGGQVCRIQEKSVEGVATSWRTVHRGAAFEDAGVVFGIVHADQRSVVVEG